jgi:hypothetical protein
MPSIPSDGGSRSNAWDAILSFRLVASAVLAGAQGLYFRIAPTFFSDANGLFFVFVFPSIFEVGARTILALTVYKTH